MTLLLALFGLLFHFAEMFAQPPLAALGLNPVEQLWLKPKCHPRGTAMPGRDFFVIDAGPSSPLLVSHRISIGPGTLRTFSPWVDFSASKRDIIGVEGAFDGIIICGIAGGHLITVIRWPPNNSV